jgi:hypothetical protein
MPIWRRLLISFVALARSEMLVYMGYTNDMRIAMIARTTITSISVKAREKQEFLVIDSVCEVRMILIGSPERKRKRTAYKEVA